LGISGLNKIQKVKQWFRDSSETLYLQGFWSKTLFHSKNAFCDTESELLEDNHFMYVVDNETEKIP